MFDTLRRDFRRNPDPLARLVLAIFRFGQWTAGRRTLPRRLCVLPYKILNLVVIRLGTNSDLPRELRCGPGLRLFHPYGLVLHRGARLGVDVDLYHHVTIGRRDFTGEPVIGDEVMFGAGASALGPVVIGPRAKIAAKATVLDDVPAGGIALGPRAEVRPPAPGSMAGGRLTADPLACQARELADRAEIRSPSHEVNTGST
jgi:serine acetyltransferase